MASGLRSPLVSVQNSRRWRKRDFLMPHTMCGSPCFLSEIQVCVHSLWSKDVELWTRSIFSTFFTILIRWILGKLITWLGVCCLDQAHRRGRQFTALEGLGEGWPFWTVAVDSYVHMGAYFFQFESLSSDLILLEQEQIRGKNLSREPKVTKETQCKVK